MLADNVLEEDVVGLPARAVAAGLAALCAAALAAWTLDGAPPGRQRGQAVPVVAAVVGPGAAVGGPDLSPPAPPVARMRFHGPGGELFEFPAAQRRLPATADAGPRGAGTP